MDDQNVWPDEARDASDGAVDAREDAMKENRLKEGEVQVNFQPGDLDCHPDLCVAFAQDMDYCSFGSVEQFCGPDGNGAKQYLARMRQKLAADPESCLHVWRDGIIVGQMNLGSFLDPAIAYISLFYVVPAWRGMGVAHEMEEYAVQWFVQRGFASARLSVVPSNGRAVRFYQRCGWQDLGPRPDKPELHNMEKTFP